MRRMTHDQWRAFVMEGTHTGKLATTRLDGGPHVVPVWFVLDGDDFVFTTGEATVKGRSLLRDGRAAICVDLEESPYSYVSAEGRAQISRDQEELLRWATTIGGRYMGADRAEEFSRRNAVLDELLVRLTPDRVTAFADLAD
ncbi:PPOX class F420-dependent oxidoreductase [Candidatus Nephthysia bennettiae]